MIPVLADASINVLTGGLAIHHLPANTQIMLRSEGKAENRRVTEDRVDVPEGNYLLTATAPGYNPLSLAIQIQAGKTQEVNIALQATVDPNHQGITAWDKPQEWQAEGNLYVHQGGNFVLSKITSGAGTYAITILRHSKKLQWLVNFRDENNYDLFAIDKKNFYRTSIRNGKKEQAIKAAHNLDEKETLTLQIMVTPDSVLHQVREGGKWVTLDDWRFNRGAAAGGKFGFYLPGKDQVAFSQFSFKPQ
jgi:hypothetical protein